MIRNRSFNRMMLAALVAAGVAAGNAAAQHAPAPVPASQLPGYLVANETYDQWVVKFRDTARRSTFHKQVILDGAAASLTAKSGRRSALHLGIARTLALGSEVVKSDGPLNRADADALVRALASHPDVEYAEVDVIVRPATGDRWWGKQWNLQAGRWGLDAPTAWEVTKGEGIVVGVVDTGITPHRELDARRLPGYNFHERNADTLAVDLCEHGNHVESIITAKHDDWGVAGIAPNANVIPIRAIDCDGGRNSDIAEAILWAAGAPVPGVPDNANPANVINISLAAQSDCHWYMQSAIDVATSRGAIVVAAAGNVPGWDVQYIMPANCNNVIAVGMTDSSGQKAANSATGAKLLWAPGNGVPVMSSYSNGLGHGTAGGTSMAAPHVAATIALMQSRELGSLTTAQAEAKLRQTASDLPSGGRLINAGRAVRPFASGLDRPVQLVMDYGHVQRCMQSVGNGTQVQGTSCLTAGNQQMWAFNRASDGYYKIVNRRTDACLDVDGASSSTGARVLEWSCHAGNNQRWVVELLSRNDMQLRARVKSLSSGKCLAISPYSVAMQVPCTDANTVWTMRNSEHRLPLKEHGLYASQGGACITHDNNWVALSNNCAIQRMGFRLKPMDAWSDVFRIHTIDPNRCMTVEDWNDGHRYAAIRSCTGSVREQWTLENDGGLWQVRNVGTGRCLNAKGGSLTPGTWLIVWPCAPGQTNARWAVTNL